MRRAACNFLPQRLLLTEVSMFWEGRAVEFPVAIRALSSVVDIFRSEGGHAIHRVRGVAGSGTSLASHRRERMAQLRRFLLPVGCLADFFSLANGNVVYGPGPGPARGAPRLVRCGRRASPHAIE